MLVTLSGIWISVKFLHTEKAASPIWVTLFGIWISVIFSQSKKARTPISITFSPIVIRFKLVLP